MSLYDGQGSRSIGGAEYDDGSAVLGGSGFIEQSEVGALAPNDLQVTTTLDEASLADVALEPNDLQVSTTLEQAELAILPDDLRVATTLGQATLELLADDLQVSATLGATQLSLSPEDLQVTTRIESISFRRPIDSGAQTEVEKTEGVAVTHVMEIHYKDGDTQKVLRLTTANQPMDVTVEGVQQTFSATPENVLRIGTVTVTSDMAEQGVELQVGGVDRTFIGLVMDDDVHFRGQLVKMWRVYMDPDSGTVSAVVPDSDNGWLFHINDAIEFEEDWGGPGEGGTVTVTTRLVSRLAVLQQPTPVMANVDSHNEMLARAGVLAVGDNPDTFFQNLPAIMNKRFRWGEAYIDL